MVVTGRVAVLMALSSGTGPLPRQPLGEWNPNPNHYNPTLPPQWGEAPAETFGDLRSGSDLSG